MMTGAETIIAAVAACSGLGGVLGGLGQLITALRTRPAAPATPVPLGPDPGSAPDLALVLGDAPAQRTSTAPGSRHRAWTARTAKTHDEWWSMGAGASACVLAGALEAVVGTTGVGFGRLAVVMLAIGAAALSVFALWIGGRLMGSGISQRRLDLAIFAIAGVVMGLGAVAATLYVGAG